MARGKPNVNETKTACRYMPKDEIARALLALAVCEYKMSRADLPPVETVMGR